ncbi:MAG TPA: hypothetical protein VK454_02515 [Myxococcaceae bacterium]|nr:hypothetical protein [Myxococcaceae bacterium]
MALAGLCLVLLTAAPSSPPVSLTLDLGAALETVVGTNISPGSAPGEVAAMISLAPGVVVQERSATGELRLSYIPLLYTTALGGNVPKKLLVLQRIGFEAHNQISRSAGVFLAGNIWYGDQNYSPVVSQGTPPERVSGPPGQPAPPAFPGTLPQFQVLRVFESSTRVGFYLLTSSAVRLDFDVGYTWNEGADAASRITLPLQRGPFLDARAEIQLSSRDTIVPALRAATLAYGPIYRAAGTTDEKGSTVVADHYQVGLNLSGSELTATWAHQESHALSTQLGAGLGLVYQGSSYDHPLVNQGHLIWIGAQIPVPADAYVYPIVSGRVTYRISGEQPLELSAAAALTPIVNQFAGTVYERLEGIVSTRWFPDARVELQASVSAAGSTNPQEVDVRGELRARWNVSTHFAFTLGSRLAWVNYSVPGALNGFSWSVFLGVAGATGSLF